MSPARARLFIAVGAVVAAMGFLYFWTGTSSPDSGTSYHLLLAEAFRDGQTFLKAEPSPELLALADPYDPAQNAPYRFHDATLYKGRYYLYFGPAPAALLFLPLDLIGVELSDRVAAPLLALGAYALSAVLLLFLIGRWVPRTPTAWRVAAVAGLGLANVVPFLLRRPAVYETSIAAGLFFLMAALVALLAGTLRERPSPRLIGLGSLAMGLAIASRTSMVVALPLLIWAWWRTMGERAQWTRASVVRWTVIAGAPVAACLTLLALYNLVRFGSPIEFGTNYQLSGVNSRTFDFFSLERLLPGAWFYFADPPHIDLDFPFFTLRPEYPGTLPASFYVEPVAGILPVSPLLAVLAVAPWVARRHHDARTLEMLLLGGLLLVVSLALPLVPVVSLGAATERYQVDFATLMIVVATVAWLWLADSLRGAPWLRRATLALGATAIAFCGVVNLAFGVVGYYDGLRAARPDTYERLEGAFAWVPTIAAKLQGQPVVLETRPQGIPTTETTLQLAAPGGGVVDLSATFVANTALPPGSIVALEVLGSDDVVRRVPLAAQDTTIRAGLDGSGLHEVRIRWVLVRAGRLAPTTTDPPAGLNVAGVQVAGWTPG